MLKVINEINYDNYYPSWFIYTDLDGEAHCVVHNDSHDPWGFFVKVAKCIAFSDCTDKTVEKIFFRGKEVHYVGWLRGMTFKFKDLDGNVVWCESFPHWDH